MCFFNFAVTLVIQVDGFPDFVNTAADGFDPHLGGGGNGFQRKNIGRVRHHYGQRVIGDGNGDDIQSSGHDFGN